MTFFLQKPAVDPSEQPARLPPAGISTFMEGLGAAFSQSPSGLEKNLGVAKRRNEVKAETNDEIINRIGEDEVWRRLVDRGLAPEVPALNDTARKLLRDNLSWRQAILEIGKESAKEDPQAWGDVRITDEQIEEETNARLRAEYEDGQAILDMMPSGRGVAEFLGESAAMMADIKNVPFLLLGGGSGSIGRVMAREALINAGAEAAFLPGQFDMAERLDIPDPNVMQQLTTAALAGAGFGLVFEGLPRALRYARERNAVTEALPGRSPVQTQVMVDKAEDILAEGRPDALEQIARIPETVPRQPPYRLENPINPNRPPLIARPQALVSGGDEAAAGGAVEAPVGNWQEIEQLADEMERAATGGRSKPLLKYLKDTGVRIHPDSPEGQDLYSILGGGQQANRAMPGLFSRKRVDTGGVSTGTALDNLPASEVEEGLPGISVAAGVDNGYLSRDGLYDLIRREAAGDHSWLHGVIDARAMRKQADELRRMADKGTPEGDFLSGKAAPGGLMINKASYEMAVFDAGGTEADVSRRIAEDVMAYLRESGNLDRLLNEEVAEIMDTVRRSGGDVEFLVEQVYAREIDTAEAAQIRSQQSNANPQSERAIQPFFTDDFPAPEPRGAADQASQRPSGGSQPAAGSAGSGAAGSRRDATDPPAYERTAAGDQQLAPGIAPVSERQRLEAQMNRPMQGGTAAADDGLFDLNARLQTEMFEPDSPAFTERTQSVTQSFRDDIEANGDFEMSVQLEDGRTLSRASEVLDYLDEGDEFADIIALCGRPRGDGA